ncbi:MAG: thiamine diphosphokinase [Clostridiales bacterium]|jgi:thiamine pyrophosphokinase|nr:thiamine diphosphokinase [Eubacteriales bacterium]MDH7566621.1 thiamine diphosphokinase [Clostridiales bacterium]
MKAVIVCNGDIEDYTYYKKYFEEAGLVICVDGGARHLRKLGIVPHVLLGDFDSISEADLSFFKNSVAEIIKFPVEKDKTDTELAVAYAVEKGCSSLFIIGGIGSRIDHSLANVFLLKKAVDMGVKGFIVNESNEITLIKDRIELSREEAKVTLLPLFEKVEGVTTKGLYYPLTDATLEMGWTWGVSNEFDSELAEVTVKKGYLLVIKSRD